MNNVMTNIAVMGTGDELVQGEILNTNAQYVCQRLVEHQLAPGMSLTVADELTAMTEALVFLLQRHAVVITIGGLGPTVDDITRQAIANALGVSLVFDEPSWAALEQRFKDYDFPLTHNNKQQCWFPEGGDILANPLGSAQGCFIEHNGCRVFMLPGPPRECLPLFDQAVLPRLLTFNLTQSRLHYRAILIEVSESAVADCLGAVFDEEPIEIGYRCHYPYLDVKFYCQDSALLQRAIECLKQYYDESIVSEKGLKASEQLLNYLRRYPTRVSFVDHATGGLLQHTLVQPGIGDRLHWTQAGFEGEHEVRVQLSGMDDYWSDTGALSTELNCVIKVHGKKKGFHHVIRVRGVTTVEAAVEWACHDVLQCLETSLT